MNNLYFVNFGGFSISTADSIHDENGRDISEYDGVGAGKFNVPDSRDPRKWEIKCTLYEDSTQAAKWGQWKASEIFKACSSLFDNSTQPSRLIISNVKYPSANISVLAWLKTFQSDEGNSGVFETTLNFEEYKPVGVKTTGVPTVKRPGKLPTPPKVTVTAKSTVYKSLRKTGAATAADAISSRNKKHDDPKALYDPKSGKPLVNAASVKTGSTWNIGTKKGGTIKPPPDNTYNSDTGFVLQSTFDSIGNAIKKFITGHY